MGHHVAQKHSRAYPKRTLGCVQTQLMLPQDFKNVYEISHRLGHHFALYNHVINVNFNAPAQLWFEHFSHHPLIG